MSDFALHESQKLISRKIMKFPHCDVSLVKKLISRNFSLPLRFVDLQLRWHVELTGVGPVGLVGLR